MSIIKVLVLMAVMIIMFDLVLHLSTTYNIFSYSPFNCHHHHFGFTSERALFVYFVFSPHLKHPQTSCPGDPCQDDIFLSGQPNYSSATLSHKDVPPDSLMKVGVQEINEDISLNLFYSF